MSKDEDKIKQLKKKIDDFKLEQSILGHRINLQHAPIFKRLFYLQDEIPRLEAMIASGEFS